MNKFKHAIAERQRQIGLWQALASPYTAEICAGAGFDWLLIDGEHAPNDLRGVLAQLQAIAPYPVEPVLRLPSGDPVLIKQYLDLGARSLLIPMIETGAQARQMVAATRYAPRGIRGVGAALGRASAWNRRENYMNLAEAEICLLLQVESIAGLAALPDIATVDGVDGVFVGPADLAASMGYLGQPTHPDVQGAVEKAIKSILQSGKAAGILASDDATIQRYLGWGVTFAAVGTDIGLLARGAEALARRYARTGTASGAAHETGAGPY